MRRLVLASLGALALAACATTSGGPAAPATAPVPDTALGLSKGSVFDVPSPPPVTEEGSGPGEKPPLPRPFPDAPPLVPHGIAGFLPITPQSNSCVDCHAAAREKKPGEPTPLPASHYTDLRNAPKVVGDKVAGARWVCVSCHVPVTDAKPLVGNRFSQRP